MKTISVLAATVLLAGVVFGGSGERKKDQPQKNIMDEGSIVPASGQRIAPVLDAAGITWVLIDSMANCYGMLSNRVKPLAYDPPSGMLAMIHRGHTAYAVGSGQLWYNTSSDGGTTWTRVSELNAGNPTNSRYPSATISNPGGGAPMLFSHASPQLNPAAFGFTIYGVDILGSGSPFAVEAQGTNTYWSNTSIWAASDNPWVLWTTRRSTEVDYYLWRTNDYVTISEGVPPQWAASNFQALGLDIGGSYRDGTHYFALWGDFSAPDPITPDANVGYSRSTDNGATWSAWIRPQPNWRITNVGPYHLWDFGGAGVFSIDMSVDANDRVHFFGAVVDTVTLQRGIVEIYETGSGWAGKVISNDLKESTVLTYNGLNQMGNHLNAATSPDGQVMALFWLDAAAQGDTLPDIWFAYRRIADNNWSTPVNLTQTGGPPPEILLQVAGDLRSNGGNSYTAFIARAYDCTGAFPPNDLTCTNVFVGAHTFTADPVSVGEHPELPSRFALEQNYPNPFNPLTRIEYMLPVGSEVKLTVHNVLGQEVATLVNEFRNAGSHSAEFSAANLPSGVYYYTIRAGSFTTTSKMMLMK